MVSTFLEKKNITETSKQEEEVISNVAFTVYGGSTFNVHIWSHYLCRFTIWFLFRSGVWYCKFMIYCTEVLRRWPLIYINPDNFCNQHIFLSYGNPSRSSEKSASWAWPRRVGPVHLPTFEDRYQLPYIEAIYRELLRWRPPLSMCVPHISTEDDYYKGYYIPKGISSSCFVSTWFLTPIMTL